MMEESFTPPPATPAPAPAPASDARPADHFDWRAELKGLAAMLAIVLMDHYLRHRAQNQDVSSRTPVLPATVGTVDR